MPVDPTLGTVANVSPDVAALASVANTAVNAAGPNNRASLAAKLNALTTKTTADVAAAQASIDATQAQINTLTADAATVDTTAIDAAYQTAQDLQPTLQTLTYGATSTVTDDPAYLAILSQFNAWNMSDIAGDIARIRADYPDISSADMLTLLRTSPTYNSNYMKRFAGNKALMDAGKPMLTEADYLRTESAYQKIFKAYDLPQFQSIDYYAKLIGNEVDATEVGSRVSLGYNRVLHADPETLQAWKNFYPMLSTGDIVGAMLDPNNQLPALERKVTTAEVGGAALAQGLNAYAAATTVKNNMFSNVTSGTIGAEAAVAAGENLVQAKSDYQKIAAELPRAEFLSSISPQLAQYGQVQAEQANILGLASAQRKKQEQVALENARWSGQAGTYGSRSLKDTQQI